MACRYFEDARVARCGAVEGLVTPSLHERERFCLGEPERCRTLRARRLLGEPIAESLYYLLWLAPGRRDEATAADAPHVP